MNLTNKPLPSAIFATGVGLLMFSLAGCATMSGTDTGSAPKETIGYSVGPCFGFCPVYSVEVSPGGHVTYVGDRNTSVLGPMETDAGARGYQSMSTALAAYRPVRGTTADTQCDQRRTDQQHYTIIWTQADGTRPCCTTIRGAFRPRMIS